MNPEFKLADNVTQATKDFHRINYQVRANHWRTHFLKRYAFFEKKSVENNMVFCNDLSDQLDRN